MADIFISYKREEQQIAKRLADALQKKGWTVWWDREIRAGERFDDVIEKALKESKCVVVLWSKLSVNSQNVKDEASFAMNLGKLVPIMIERVNLPFRFERFNTGQLIDWDGSDKFPGFQKLIADVISILGEPPVEAEKRKREQVEREAENKLWEEEQRKAKEKRELLEKEIQRLAEQKRKFEEEQKRIETIGIDETERKRRIQSSPDLERRKLIQARLDRIDPISEPAKKMPCSIRAEAEGKAEVKKQRLAGEKRKSDPAAVKSTEPPSTQKTITNSMGMKFVLIQAGKFIMGSPPGEQGRKINEKQHEVIISRDFYLQTTPVSQNQWKRVMRDNPSGFKKYGHDCPVDRVSWDMAQQFIDKLNQIESTFKYRLPTEAEWEYACRAGTKSAYSFGGEVKKLGDYAWYRDNADNQTHPAGIKKPNSWGLYDMHGNIWEWCQDWFGSYSNELKTDPIRLTNPNMIGVGIGPIAAVITLGGMVKKKLNSGRVCRGGSCLSDAKFLRSACRKHGSLIPRIHDIGIRVALNL